MTPEPQYYAQRLARMIRCKTVSVKGSYDDAEFCLLYTSDAADEYWCV